MIVAGTADESGRSANYDVARKKRVLVETGTSNLRSEREFYH